MGFNLKKILTALLFSTSEPLSIKDIQAVITRYHSENDGRNKQQSAAEEPDDAADALGVAICHANTMGPMAEPFRIH